MVTGYEQAFYRHIEVIANAQREQAEQLGRIADNVSDIAINLRSLVEAVETLADHELNVRVVAPVDVVYAGER